MSSSVTMAAASAAPQRRPIVVSGMLMVPKSSHVPATAETSTTRSRILRPLVFFRAALGSLGVSRSTWGAAPGRIWGRRKSGGSASGF